jgi:hypothetical protein
VSDGPLERLAARAALGLAADDEYAAAAVAALETGLDAPSLALLAAGAGDAAEAQGLLDGALHELGWPGPGPRDAALLLARAEAGAILAGERTPRDGAERIWDLTVRAEPERIPELDAFVYAASEWRERPEEGARWADGVRAAARDLLAA